MASCSSHGAWQYQPASNFIRRFYGCPLLDAAKRWRALRGVFKTLAGCLYHTHRRDTNTSCCTTACREAVLPFSPPAHPHHTK